MASVENISASLQGEVLSQLSPLRLILFTDDQDPRGNSSCAASARHFIVKDNVSGNCNVVAPSMKLEQSIQRTPKSEAGKQDIILRSLRFISQLRARYVHELWVEFGSDEHRRHLPQHGLTD